MLFQRRKLPVYFVPVAVGLLILLVTFFALWGSYAWSLTNENQNFDLLGAIYSIFTMFLIDYNEPYFPNWQLAVASFLAAILLGFGILTAAYRYLFYNWMLLHIRRKYTRHTIIFGIGKIGYRIAVELLKSGHKVVAIEPNGKNVNIVKIREKGGMVIIGTNNEEEDLLHAGITRAENCLIFKDSDESNLQTANLISYMNQKGVIKQHLRVQILTYAFHNYSFLKDYMDAYTKTKTFNMDPFSPSLAAAQIIFDSFSPLRNVQYEVITDETNKVQRIQSSDNAIIIVGYTDTARAFIMENIILSHSPGLRNLKILLIEKNAKQCVEKLRFTFPFVDEYLDIIPMELENEHFYGASFESESFKSYLQKLSGVYFFGDEDAVLTQLANSFRQTLYKEIGELATVPLVVCLPENSRVIDLLDPDTIQSEGLDIELFQSLRTHFNINFVKQLTDTCTKAKLIDEIGVIDGISKAVNYFYSIKYEFEWLMDDAQRALFQPKLPDLEAIFLNVKFKTRKPVAELETIILTELQHILDVPLDKLRPTFGIQARWDALSDLKQDSNRYVARHLEIKVGFLEKIGHDIAHLDRAMVEPYFKVFAPIEHKRWCSEKLCFKFKYGPFPNDKKMKKLLKDTLKTHDQLIDYALLDKEMEDKDFNMFLLIPVLQGMKTILQGN